MTTEGQIQVQSSVISARTQNFRGRTSHALKARLDTEVGGAGGVNQCTRVIRF